MEGHLTRADAPFAESGRYVMPLTAPLLAAFAVRANRAVAQIVRAPGSLARGQRERRLLQNLSELDDARLHDLGLSRDAIRCGLRSRNPLAAARAHRRPTVGGLNSMRWGDASVWPDRQFRRERYLGW